MVAVALPLTITFLELVLLAEPSVPKAGIVVLTSPGTTCLGVSSRLGIIKIFTLFRYTVVT